jgi:hypothetical protein
MRFVAEASDWISATQGEGMGPSQIIPKLLEFDGGIRVSLGPEEGDHFSEGGHARILAFGGSAGSRNDVPNGVEEKLWIGLPITHEL